MARVSRQSPAKIEGEAREAAETARAAAIAAGQTEEEAAEAAEAAADAVRKGLDPAAPPAAGPGDDDDEPVDVLEKVIPEAVAQRIAADQHKGALGLEERRLLAEACFVFGINPDPTLKPRELAAYRYDQGDPNGATPVPAYVVLVTAGGVKARYPIDDDTEARLRSVYGCFRVNPKTGEREVLPLPPDLTLPKEAIDGQPRTSEHQYRTGYLREGGRNEADRRQTLDELRRVGKIR